MVPTFLSFRQTDSGITETDAPVKIGVKSTPPLGEPLMRNVGGHSGGLQEERQKPALHTDDAVIIFA